MKCRYEKGRGTANIEFAAGEVVGRPGEGRRPAVATGANTGGAAHRSRRAEVFAAHARVSHDFYTLWLAT